MNQLDTAHDMDTERSTSADRRKPYEAPKVLLKRSVANAILASVPNATGPSGSMLTSTG